MMCPLNGPIAPVSHSKYAKSYVHVAKNSCFSAIVKVWFLLTFTVAIWKQNMATEIHVIK